MGLADKEDRLEVFSPTARPTARAMDMVIMRKLMSSQNLTIGRPKICGFVCGVGGCEACDILLSSVSSSCDIAGFSAIGASLPRDCVLEAGYPSSCAECKGDWLLSRFGKWRDEACRPNSWDEKVARGTRDGGSTTCGDVVC